MLIALLFAAVAATPVTVDVDASRIADRIVHTRQVFGAAPGTLRLGYPKWLPGEHGPTGPLNSVVNLRVTASGKALVWRRDLADPWIIDVEVPAGTTAVQAEFDYVAGKGGLFSEATPASQNAAVLMFNHVVLVPVGTKTDDIAVKAKVKLPRGWKYGCGLLTSKRSGDTVELEPTTMTGLVDAPMNMGRYHRRIDLGTGHTISIVAESEAALQIPADTITEWKQLVAEAGALFGSRPYRHYEFLLTLSDLIEPFGLEHHESSDNRVYERSYIDDDKRPVLSSLLPHEMAHSWNGKFRRPAGLATGDYSTPMRTDLLWVYEGLTEYFAWVLSARSGLQRPAEWAADRALWSAEVLARAGKSWRPLQDLNDGAQEVYRSPMAWRDLRRGVDFYDEGCLLWLGVDVKIRSLTNGKKSLDDFARVFFGGPQGKPEVKPYTFDDVISALNAVAPFDWQAWWKSALDRTGSTLAADALASAGWRVGFVEKAPEIFTAYESAFKARDLRFSIGLLLDADSGEISDVMGGSAAFKAGLTPGMKLIAVNGRKDSPEVLADAIAATKTGTTVRAASLELLVENAEHYRSVKLDYRGGHRFPLLMRDDKAPDVLAQIFAPRTPHQQRSKKPD